MPSKPLDFSTRRTLAKLDTLEAAIRGDMLSTTQENQLRVMMDDYRPLIRLGAKKPISAQDCIEAFKIVIDEVGRMTGNPRRQALLLLHKVQARGFETAIYREDENPIDPELADRLTYPVTPEEIGDALLEAELERTGYGN